MADYSDVPQINTLYLQSQRVADAINLLDAGGMLTNVVISPPTEQAAEQPISIDLPGPQSPELLAEVRAQLVQAENQIVSNMLALGVTETPPAHD